MKTLIRKKFDPSKDSDYIRLKIGDIRLEGDLYLENKGWVKTGSPGLQISRWSPGPYYRKK